MKLALSILTLVFSMTAFAGPEDHLQNQTCYVADVKAGEVLPASVPAEICLEDVVVNAEANSISIFSYFQPEIWEDLGLIIAYKRSQTEFKFLASKVLSENSDTSCGNAEVVELFVIGLTDAKGKGNPAAVEISVTHRVTRDSCHSDGQTIFYPYRLK